MGEHFCLKWNNHQENLTGIMAKLLEEQKFVDVSLVCERKTFKAHQTVLSACSPYFQQVLEENPHPHPVIILRDVKECEMASLLQYMYRGEVNVTNQELSTFLKTAKDLLVRGLSDNKRDNTLIDKADALLPTSSSPQLCSPPPKRRRVSTSPADTAFNDRVNIETMRSPSPSPIVCKNNQSQKASSTVSTSSFSDNLSDVPYVDTPTPSGPSAIKQEVDGASLHSHSDQSFHGLSQHLSSSECGQRKPREGYEHRDTNASYVFETRVYSQQKVELPKVPVPHTQSFSSQLQAPPLPELYPCGTKGGKLRRTDAPNTVRNKEQAGPSACNSGGHQPVSVIRNSEAADVQVQRKGGRFRPGWTENYAWLQYDEGLNAMFCKTCRKWSSSVPDIRTSFVEGNANFRLEIVNHHDKSKAHRLCMAKEEESMPGLAPIMCDGNTPANYTRATYLGTRAAP